MLPTKGYFQDIECPYYESQCNRPYCHFRHRKKGPETVDESTAERLKPTKNKSSSSAAAVAATPSVIATQPPPVAATAAVQIPTYKPTPKSELAANNRSHIPISYVPDLAFRPDRPARPPPKYSLPTYKPTPLSILSSVNNNAKQTDTVDEIKTIREIKQNIANNEYNPEVSLQLKDIDFEDLSAEFDLIDDIIGVDEPPLPPVLIDEKKKSPPPPQASSPPKSKEENKKRKLRHEEDEGGDNNVGEQLKEHKSSGSSSSNNGNNKNKNKKTVSDKSSSSSKDKQHKSSSEHKHSSSKSKHHHHKHDDNPTKSDKDIKKVSSSSNNSDRHSKHKRRRSKEKERSRHKDKDRNEKRKRDDSQKNNSNKDNRTNRKHKHEKTSTKNIINNKSSDGEEKDDDEGGAADLDYYSDIEMNEEEEENDTMLECYKIFNEYKAPDVEQEIVDVPTKNMNQHQSNPTNEDQSIVGKKRVAHHTTSSNNNNSDLTYKIQQHVKPKMQPSPAQIMSNRFKLAKQQQANNEQQNLINEVKQQQNLVIKRPTTTTSTSTNTDFPHTNASTSSSIRKLTTNNGPRKIAPAQNVNSIQRAKAKIEEIAKRKAAVTLLSSSSSSKTQAQTCKATTKRVAHVPEIASLADIPDVFNIDKSKLPVNVRTRFLGMIAEECLKLYLIKDDAYNRALQEEFSCYEKCKVLVTYRNSAMLAVNRLRKEMQERERLNLGPLGSGSESINNKSSKLQGKSFYDSITGYILTDDDLNTHGYPRESTVPGRAVIHNRRTNNNNKSAHLLDENCRKCSRCSKIYLVDDYGIVLYEEECVYHPLKKRTIRGEQTYLCCKSNDEAGCATASTHVSEMSEEAELEGYQLTMDPDSTDDPRNYAVYALDCEMCYTTKGLELTRVTIVDVDCKTVYESLVKPLSPIIDYNTNFSGITQDQMERTSTSILQVQANILHLCNSKTILIGHSLESDMKALKIIHGNIIDTAVLFPHKMGLPHKRALRMLASEYLKKIIQNGVNGHDSAEDAVTCMELVMWKLKEDMKTRNLK